MSFLYLPVDSYQNYKSVELNDQMVVDSGSSRFNSYMCNSKRLSANYHLWTIEFCVLYSVFCVLYRCYRWHIRFSLVQIIICEKLASYRNLSLRYLHCKCQLKYHAWEIVQSPYMPSVNVIVWRKSHPFELVITELANKKNHPHRVGQ